MDYFKKLLNLKSSKGQVTVEYILLAFILLVFMQLAFKQIREGDYFRDFVSGPNQIIANMLENGTWNLSSDEARRQHPNQFDRHFSWNP